MKGSVRFRPLPFFLVLIPACFCALIYMLHQGVYIPELNLALRGSVFSYVTLIWSFVWINVSPFRSACREHIFSEVAFYLVPITLPGLLLFAQWHFELAVVLLCAAVLSVVLVLIRLPTRDFNHLTRWLTSTWIAVLVVPALITWVRLYP